MERAAVLERLRPGFRAPIVWRVATVRDVRPESDAARTIVLDVPEWPGHVPGQHLDVRLTAEDGWLLHGDPAEVFPSRLNAPIPAPPAAEALGL